MSELTKNSVKDLELKVKEMELAIKKKKESLPIETQKNQNFK